LTGDGPSKNKKTCQGEKRKYVNDAGKSLIETGINCEYYCNKYEAKQDPDSLFTLNLTKIKK